MGKLQLVCMACCIILFAGVTHADDTGAGSKSPASQIESFVTLLDSTDLNEDTIPNLIRLASPFSASERAEIFSQTRTKVLVPFLVNTVIGFGVGSALQRDWIGTIFEVDGQFGGLALIDIAGIIAQICSEPRGGDQQGATTTGTCDREDATIKIIAAAGAGLFLASRVYGMIRPIVYANRRNKNLLTILGLSKVSFTIFPDIRLIDGTTKIIGLNFGIKL